MGGTENSRLLDPTGSEGGNQPRYLCEGLEAWGRLSRPVEAQGLIHRRSLRLIHGPWLPGAGQVSVLQKPPDLCGKAAQRCIQALEGLAKCFQLQGVPQSATVA